MAETIAKRSAVRFGISQKVLTVALWTMVAAYAIVTKSMAQDASSTATNQNADDSANQNTTGTIAIYNENVPDEIRNCIAAKSGFTISGKTNPFYLRGDFDGDGKMDFAVVVNHHGEQGIMICRGGKRRTFILGAGIAFDWGSSKPLTDLDFDAWMVYPKGRQIGQGVEEGKPPRLLGDAIYVSWSERASAILHWNGQKFKWYQQGD